MIVLDVDDELGERLELESAAPEPAGIGEERSGGDARHVHGAGAFTGQRGGGGGPGAGVVNEEAEVSGPGIGTEQTPGGQTGQRRTQLGGRRGGGRRRRRGGWWHTSRPAYLLV